ncbi:Transglutaminase-like superfamily protein [Agrococcus baldri]|uniref:Transglutaminase-like superfamily protein n=1 Tax=Agrococcus baldri TaxID=153730 RepID=A0AA94HKA2_9MICO|nr:transglutaminaseTgpA domain-containing protein [Agrococcus baldri]SFR98800.1 Transglutaminase-like superfamily protein [Agrococcus baldri]
MSASELLRRGARRRQPDRDPGRAPALGSRQRPERASARSSTAQAGTVETIALAVLPIAWLWSAITVLGEAWLWPVVAAVATMTIAASLVRAVWPPLVASAAAALAGVAWVTGLTAPEQAILGIVPTPEAVLESLAVLNQGVIDIAWAQSTPLDATGAVLAVIVAAAVAVTVMTDVLGHGLRVPAVAVVVAAAPLLLPIAFRIDVPWWHALPGVIATAAVLVAPAIDERAAQPRGWVAPVALVAAAAVLSAAVPLVAPSPRESEFDLPTFQELFTPATPVLSTRIDLGDELRRPADRPVFTYSTTDGDPIVSRLMTLPEAGPEGFVALEPQPGSPQELVEGAGLGEPVRMTVRMGDVRAESLPTPERVAGLQAREGSSWDDANDALRISADVETRELEYTATGTRSLPLDQLPADAGSSGHDPYLAMPEAAAAIVTQGAALVDEGMSAAQRVQAVHGFMTEGLWNYSEQLDLPGFAGAGGDGWEALAGFLETRSGYCVHYASATAGLLRGAGVPARVVIGFLPGSDISGGWAVSTNDMHAWAEAWIDGAGWVRVETTPGAGTGVASPEGAEITQSPTPEPTPSETPEETAPPTASPTPSTAPTAPAPSDSAAPGAPSPGDGITIDPALLRALLIGLGVLLVLALPAIVRAVQRAVRLRRGATGGWAELRATLADLGTLLPASATPGQLQAALASRVEPAAAAAADRVRLTAERAAFDAGPRDRGVVDADVRTVRQALAAGAPWWRRTLAAVLPRSLAGIVARDDDEG